MLNISTARLSGKQKVSTYLLKSVNLNFRSLLFAGAILVPNSGYITTEADMGLYAKPVTANVHVVEKPKVPITQSSATQTTIELVKIEKEDVRKVYLETLFNKYKAPLGAKAQAFLDTADKYNLDWRLLPAISIIESQGGRRIPKNSYNAWGWGIPTGAKSGKAFASWEAGIETVARGLKEKYVDIGLDTPEKMNRKYAASKVWGSNVRKVMNKISPTVEVQ